MNNKNRKARAAVLCVYNKMDPRYHGKDKGLHCSLMSNGIPGALRALEGSFWEMGRQYNKVITYLSNIF
jgi:hypothetical protein